MMIPPSLVVMASGWVARVVLTLAAVFALVGTGYYLGAKSTKADWHKERAELAVQQLAAEREARAKERERADEAQRIADRLAEAQAVLRDRAARAERSVVGLRDTIARLNGRPAPADPEAARLAREANSARELLGACAEEYRGLATEADAVREQAVGMQDWIQHVTR